MARLTVRKMFAGLCLLAVLVGTTTTVQAGKVTAEKSEHSVKISIDGEHFTTFNYAPEQTKPYFHPVYAPGKTLVVREEVFGAKDAQRNDLETNLGHHHHKGIWIGLDSINEQNFNYWGEKHVVRNESVAVAQKGNNVVLEVVNSWLDDAAQPLIKETTRYEITPERLIDCRWELAAIDKPVTFGDTKEGLFAIRLEKNLREVASGKIINADGKKTEKEAWGVPSAWVDYSGQTTSGESVGVAIFDDPSNIRPSRYHVRAYGLFSVSPFGDKSYSRNQAEANITTLKPGEAIAFRYGMYIHEGDTEQGKVADQYKKFLKMK